MSHQKVHIGKPSLTSICRLKVREDNSGSLTKFASFGPSRSWIVSYLLCGFIYGEDQIYSVIELKNFIALLGAVFFLISPLQ